MYTFQPKPATLACMYILKPFIAACCKAFGVSSVKMAIMLKHVEAK
jgi:type IV secretory pathway TrbL component